MVGVLWLGVGAFAADDGPQPIGGALAGWGAVPLASDEQRDRGLLHVWGQLQVWTTLLDQDVDPVADPATYGDPEADAGFSLQRARLGLDGFVPLWGRRGQVDYALAFGVAAPYDALTDGGPEVALVEAFGRWALPTRVGVTSAALGLQRVPFSRESLISDADLVFHEVGVGTAWLAPGRQVGLAAGQSVSLGGDAQLLLRAGAFSDDLFGGRGLLAVARLELLKGDPYRTWGRATETAVGAGLAALRDDDVATRTTSYTGDLLARWRWITVMGEVVASRIEPTNSDVADPDVVFQTDRLGALAQVSVWARLDGIQGVELAGRLATFDDELRLPDDGDVAILHAGATWRNALPRLDVGAGFVHRMEPAAARNDTLRIWTQLRPEARF